MIMRILVAVIFAAGAYIFARADVLGDASILVDQGDFGKALELLENESKRNPKATALAKFNTLLGICKFETGDYIGSGKFLEAAKAKGDVEAILYLGRLAFLDYDFDKAQDLYGEYKAKMIKAKREPDIEIEYDELRLANAGNFLERVEKITILDSIAVPADDFFKQYKLPSSSGYLLAPSEMPLPEFGDGAVVAFMNEGMDFLMWAQPDSVGNVGIVESTKLMDGKWQMPVRTPDFLRAGGFADYPFMMSDGTTLYYASDGDASMGGYDIFVVSRDAQTGEYLQPSNIGMPFNSPFDDFMLAIDEENGIGWWATDRNRLGDKLTIYVYKVNDVRVNYSPDDEDIIAKARILDWKSTQPSDKNGDITKLLTEIDGLDNMPVQESIPDFMFPKKGGGYYKFLSDFSNGEAKKAMKAYLDSENSLKSLERELFDLRKGYSNGSSRELRDKLERLEKEVNAKRSEVVRMRSEVYRLSDSR